MRGYIERDVGHRITDALWASVLGLEFASDLVAENAEEDRPAAKGGALQPLPNGSMPVGPVVVE
jgi:hypothetical protein